ncbi:hypothetical protein LB452_03265 [Psychroflexus sp. CAK8W]|uniref:NodB homology domain-containing protein n=1 Tax=Psychroflexus longus TaxID=2873596 RepID=A0ABS7XHF7_9FLAO|nr:hypothetical protein [Psychroflexus longus]MBZ9777933.1 hypothetical protein [Psychroflexus longus]
MNIYITLDYELFFGEKSGSLENCIIKPTEAILKIVDIYKVKLVCFVDVGYLVKLEEQKDEFPNLEKDYNKVTAQIRHLAENGHGIDLHIHPHWEDSYYDGSKWVFDTLRYKLADFSPDEITSIVTKYTETLKRISGKAPKAYRAGGWSAQPFKGIGKALLKNNIAIDSTVFPGGYYNSSDQYYDFRGIEPFRNRYKFSDNLTEEDSGGNFTEIPISSHKVSPLFFWKFSFLKLMKQDKHQAFGDGLAISKTKKDILRLLFSPSNSVVSVDGYKASYLKKSYKLHKKNKVEDFVIIGHPKAFTDYSLSQIDRFLKNLNPTDEVVTFNQ